MTNEIADLTGQRFGRLVVLHRDANDYITPSTGKHVAKWVCQCDCGNIMSTTTYQLRGGVAKSCGCLQRERAKQAHTKHGGRYDRLHSVWAGMKDRCYNPHYSEFDSYGGRGIKVCDEWQQYPPFKEWALSAGYDETLASHKQTLDRIDINGNYCPENCRFADMFTQANNKQNNVRIKYNGEEHTISEWASILNLTYNYFYYRVRTKGLTIQEILDMQH